MTDPAYGGFEDWDSSQASSHSSLNPVEPEEADLINFDEPQEGRGVVEIEF